MYARGKFGIEYTPSESRPEGTGFGWIVTVIVLVVVALVVRSVWVRVTTRPPVVFDDPPRVAPVPTNAVVAAEADVGGMRVPAIRQMLQTAQNRSVKVRNLLLRLAEAERMHDVEMAVSTIEQLRSTPGAADLDDALARRLGALNFHRLFDLKSAQWTTLVRLKRGDMASRVAYEHGATYASLAKLNGDALEHVRAGQTLVVMNHPRFNLVITRRTRTADLLLNGKFFKRYYLTGDVTGSDGSYATPKRFRSFCTEKGVPFKPLDRAELEMLLPQGSAAYIKDI